VLTGGLGFQIGGHGNSSYLLGDVATALAHGTALSEAEIKNYYAETVNRFYGS
jgi:hypothetical protein